MHHTLIGSLAGGYSGIIADGGINTITFTGLENFTITTGSGNDVLSTGGGVDVLFGGGGSDTLNGGAGADTLFGGAGNDFLTGGTGRDLMTGGLGADVFRFAAVNESARVAQADRITDFQHNSDKIDLSAIDANRGVASDQAFTFLGTSAFTGAAGEMHYSQAGGNMLITADNNGDMVADFAVQLMGVHTLTATDFLL